MDATQIANANAVAFDPQSICKTTWNLMTTDIEWTYNSGPFADFLSKKQTKINPQKHWMDYVYGQLDSEYKIHLGDR